MSAKFPTRVKTVECVLTGREVITAHVNLDTMGKTAKTVMWG